MRSAKTRPNWVNIIFFSLTPIIAIAGTTWLVTHGGVPAPTWILAGFYAFACGFGITGGYHRLFAHRSYDAPLPIRLLYLFFGSATFQGSCVWWAAEHRVHHRYEDTERDPYGINKGFWFAHIGWLLEKREDASYDNVRDLMEDRWVVWQQKFYLPIAIITGFLIPMGIASLWGDPWGGLIIAGFARMVFNHHATFCINSVCHYLGRRTYNDKLTARDSWITSVITYGEGYHNFHHSFQYDYRNGVRFHQWDPTKWLIYALRWLRLADNLRRASRTHILAMRLEMDQERFARRLANYSDGVRQKAHTMLTGTKERLEHAHGRFVELRSEYRTLKREGIDSVSHRLDELKAEYKWARREFRLAWAEWTHLVNGPIAIRA